MYIYESEEPGRQRNSDDRDWQTLQVPLLSNPVNGRHERKKNTNHVPACLLRKEVALPISTWTSFMDVSHQNLQIAYEVGH